jgi:hypothetical protein
MSDPRYRNQDPGRSNTTLWSILAVVAAAVILLVVVYSYGGMNTHLVTNNSAAPTSGMNAPARTVPANPAPATPAPAPAPTERTQ